MDRLFRQLPQIGMFYRTDHKPISSINRTFPTFLFYLRFLLVVFKASIKAQQGKYDNTSFHRSSLEILHALEGAGICFNISGIEHVRNLETPCVVVANHMSMLETIILPSIILPYKKMTFIVKESLMDYPVFKHILRSRQPIVVNRINPRQDLKTVLEEGVERLKQGISVIVFPQTTRTHEFDPQKFNSIGVKLARRAQVPVVPLALLTDAWGNGKFIKEFGKLDVTRAVHFSFGRPLWLSSKGIRVQQQVISFIRGNLNEWRKLEND